jgi:hypothetical protein
MGGPDIPRIDARTGSGRLSPTAVDRLLAGTVTLLQLLNPQVGPARPEEQSLLLGIAALLLAIGQGVPLLWRRSRPAPVLLIVGTAWVVAYLFVTGAAPFGLWVALVPAPCCSPGTSRWPRSQASPC